MEIPGSCGQEVQVDAYGWSAVVSDSHLAFRSMPSKMARQKREVSIGRAAERKKPLSSRLAARQNVPVQPDDDVGHHLGPRSFLNTSVSLLSLFAWKLQLAGPPTALGALGSSAHIVLLAATNPLVSRHQSPNFKKELMTSLNLTGGQSQTTEIWSGADFVDQLTRRGGPALCVFLAVAVRTTPLLGILLDTLLREARDSFAD